MFLLSACNTDKLLDEVPYFPQMPWEEPVEVYIWGSEVEHLEQNVLPLAKEIDTGRMDKAPIASKYASVFLEAIQTQDCELFLSMQNLPTDILSGIDINTWIKTAGYDQYTSVDVQDAEVSSTYNNDLAKVNFEWELKDSNGNKKPLIFSVEVQMDDDGLHIVPTYQGFRQNYSAKFPGNVISINKTDFSRYIVDQNSSTTTFLFDVFPISDIEVTYSTLFGEYSEKVTPDEQGNFEIKSVLSNEDIRQEYSVIANTLINSLWKYVWVDKNIPNDFLLNSSKSETLLKEAGNIRNKSITYVEVTSALDIKPDLTDYVVAGDIIHLNLKYITKFDISNPGLPVSMSSCKDFSWIEIKVLPGPAYVIYDLGIDDDESILTCLDYTNNEW